jgi:hypothetical protein
MMRVFSREQAEKFMKLVRDVSSDRYAHDMKYRAYLAGHLSEFAFSMQSNCSVDGEEELPRLLSLVSTWCGNIAAAEGDDGFPRGAISVSAVMIAYLDEWEEQSHLAYWGDGKEREDCNE